MSKIDNSTYKAIKRERSWDNSFLSHIGEPEKGTYGRIKKRMIIRLVMVLLLLAVIVADVLISVLVFKTRKTWFVIIACVMSIPFARNLIDLFMTIKCKPLDKDLQEKVEAIGAETGRRIDYDLTITDEDGVVFLPAVCVYNNNVIAFTPDEKDAKKRERVKSFMGMLNSDPEISCRIFVTENINTFKKELARIREADEAALTSDEYIRETLFSLGF
ncbi:MAG: hypothetical protein J5517_10425 [Eubacterium sp.]|nr:hypothetical protein [Eubacterium sp.]